MQLPKVIRGRRVKRWKRVYEADDAIGDDWVPIFNTKNQRRKRRRY